MLNNVTIQGIMSRKPEPSRNSNPESPTTMFTVICEGEVSDVGRKPSIDYIRAVAFGATAERIMGTFDKGDPIIIEGSLHSYRFMDRNGEQRDGHEVIVRRSYKCDPGSRAASAENPAPTEGAPQG